MSAAAQHEQPGLDEEQAGPDTPPAAEMTFLEHLLELRQRLVYSLIALGVGFSAAYSFAEDIFHLLMAPLIGSMQRMNIHTNLVYTGLTEAFFTYVQVALYAGAFLASPVIFYQFWRFISPGLYESERRYIVPVAVLSALFFVSGALFGYFLVFPVGFEFFLSYSSEYIQALPSVKEYLSLSLGLLLAFGVVFETPIFVFFMVYLGLVTPQALARKRRWAILMAFVVAAVLTPTPDAVSQLLMAGPLIILFEVGILASRILVRNREKEADEPDDGPDIGPDLGPDIGQPGEPTPPGAAGGPPPDAPTRQATDKEESPDS